MNFAENLKKLRKELNLTQEELAQKLSKTRSTIAGYETERKEPDYETLKTIANYFNVTVDYLLGRTDIRNNTHEDDESPKSLDDYIKEAQTLMLYGKIMDENDKKALLTAIKVAYETAIKEKEKDKNDKK